MKFCRMHQSQMLTCTSVASSVSAQSTSSPNWPQTLLVWWSPVRRMARSTAMMVATTPSIFSVDFDGEMVCLLDLCAHASRYTGGVTPDAFTLGQHHAVKIIASSRSPRRACWKGLRPTLRRILPWLPSSTPTCRMVCRRTTCPTPSVWCRPLATPALTCSTPTLAAWTCWVLTLPTECDHGTPTVVRTRRVG